jgi:hypothetical protein
MRCHAEEPDDASMVIIEAAWQRLQDGVQGAWLSVELILAAMEAPMKEARKQRMKDTLKR